jgi:hypothetical protein
MISEVKKHHEKTFVVLNWESSNEKLLVGYSRTLNSDSSILSSFSLYAIVLHFSFSYLQNAAKNKQAGPLSVEPCSGLYCIERCNN